MRILLLLGVIAWNVAIFAALPTDDHCGTKTVDSFAVGSFKAIAEDASGNFVYSPTSLTSILSMTYWGTAGNTKEQLASVVLNNPHESVPKRDLESFEDSSEEIKGVELRMATKIFHAEGFTPKPNFIFMTTMFYGSEAQSINFGKSDEASKTINSWCAAQTNNRIKDLVKPADLNSDTALVLANAVYFKGDWLNQFDEDYTELLPFHVNEKTVKQVPTMRKVGSYNYGELPEIKAKFIELPYKTNAKSDPISMFIILPDEVNGIDELIKNFEKVTTKKLHEGNKWDVDLFLPKFKIETTIDLKNSLVKLGLTDIFGPSANFSEISEERPLAVSKIVQKTFIEVNERGTEAASATGTEIDARMESQPEVTFNVNRPFISIVVTEFGLPLFSAVTVDPISEH